MHDLTPIPAFLGGALIGLAASLLLLTHGRVAGISGLYGSLLRRDTSDRAFRLWFLAGLAIAGLALRIVHPAAFATSWNAAPNSCRRSSTLVVVFDTCL